MTEDQNFEDLLLNQALQQDVAAVNYFMVGVLISGEISVWGV